jgi:Zn-dependent protease
MTPTRQGSFRLFRFAGIDVFLHWSWFLVAVWQINEGKSLYSTQVWSALQYLALFVTVLLHEFGHALACRSVGGEANQIVLWPLGGVAYVSPPPRPGATLWSIAAGPLVNVALVPVLSALSLMGASLGWAKAMPDAYKLVQNIWLMNVFLLVLNLMPIYPLDGGQILRSLLWFVLGRARSLMVATIIGFIGAGCLLALLVGIWFLSGGIGRNGAWFAVLVVFILLNCMGGLMQARVLARIAKLPRRGGFACPSCQQAPPIGPFWRCDQCRNPFDTFETGAVCPNCGNRFGVTRCIDCGKLHPMSEWIYPAVAAPPRV